MLPVVLASASPRRIELLKRLVTDFEVDPAHVDEESYTRDDPAETARLLACVKAREVAKRHLEAIVIGGDTVVALGSEQFAKPSSGEDACRMLSRLSGRTHRVITGICVVWPGGETSFADVAEVEFRELSGEEIATYVATGEPMDKAGAYAIQGGAAGFVKRMTGDPETVIGFPTRLVGEALRASLGA